MNSGDNIRRNERKAEPAANNHHLPYINVSMNNFCVFHFIPDTYAI